MGFQATPNADVEIRDLGWIRRRAEHGDGDFAHVVTDRHGFRYAGDLDEPKRPGELRVFLLGGSVVVLGMRNETTICGYLETRLRERLGPNRLARCVTAGIMTAVSDQELAVLVHKIADLEPDIVIALDGYNDLAIRTHFDPRLGYPVNWMVLERGLARGLDAAREIQRVYREIPTWRLLLSRSRLATRTFPGLVLDDQISGVLRGRVERNHPRPDLDAIVEHLLGNWGKMARFSRAIGAEFVAVLQPARPKERGDVLHAAFYERMNEEIRRARRSGRPFHSFDRRFDDRRDLFYDSVHTFDEGNALMADWLLALLEAEALLGVADSGHELGPLSGAVAPGRS